ncbi:MAG TPA: RluA family pseudouridine synthase [Patescibacteria group bacterium]|jgi:23S rRNA pseudouridine1911/1915/1917 synthase|nr:RluA family pseudouridine synthase [Patescibacteria group bacterium]
MNNVELIAEEAGERLDAYLARVKPEYSRSFWQKRCSDGLVTVNDLPAKPSYHLSEGDVVKSALPDGLDFTDLSLPIIYEDDDVVVINKPTGTLTHSKGAANEEFTVADFVRPRTTDGVDTNRPGIVHRLDRGTSGILIAAKNPEAKRWLQKQFSERKVKKTYMALVEGHLKQPSARLDLPIERNPSKPQTFRVGASGKPAETIYSTEKVFKSYTLLRLSPLTGRTHQLRVHMQYLGHPIVGDSLYGAKDTISTADERQSDTPRDGVVSRLFLHAAELELTLPSRVRQVFKAPLPTDLQTFLKELSE